ncbi:hypothetical protein [Xenorhabdus sp. PB30.3]|nr:hypothetical protein [Xenorhabdus sp. PB30.3]MCC8380932.1 hypothetical protein [Xenorhabdus sp. PB30.3]
MKPHHLPNIVGNVGSAWGTETTNTLTQQGVNYTKEKIQEKMDESEE